MALILIRDICFHRLKPLLTLLRASDSYRALFYLFHERIKNFAVEIRTVAETDPFGLDKLFKQVKVPNVASLIT